MKYFENKKIVRNFVVYTGCKKIVFEGKAKFENRLLSKDKRI
jgi:hypothetical protein